MSEILWWIDYLRLESVLNGLTVVSYLLAALLFWIGWKLTKKIAADWLRVVLRAGLVAIAFAPAILPDPGGGAFIFPASLVAIYGILVLGLSRNPQSFVANHALISMLLVWCIGSVVGGVSMKLREKNA